MAITTNGVIGLSADSVVVKATFSAKGDLLLGTGNGTLTKRSIGADGEMLFADSTEADGVKWKRSLTSPFETSSAISTALGSTSVNIDLSTSSVWNFTSNPTANFPLNFRWSSSATLNSVLSNNQVVTLTIIVNQGTTAYLPASISIDGTARTVKWQGGIAPASGDASSLDVFQFSFIKTGTDAYTVLGSMVKYA